LRAGLVVAQVTVSFMLLIGAGLMLRSVVTLQNVDPGFRVDHLLTMRVSPSFSRYKSNQDFEELSENIVRSVSAVGGVEVAAIAQNYPYSKQGILSGPGKNEMQIEGHPVPKGQPAPQEDITGVSPEYFSALRQPLLTGRFFTDHDDQKALQVGIINQTMMHHFWSAEDPIGKRVSFDQGDHWIKIVGVVADAREYGQDHEAVDEIYVPVKQTGGGNRLVVRTATDPLSLAPLVNKAIRSVDPQLAIDQVESMERLQQDSMSSPRTVTILLGIFAGLALLISATGIAGVLALAVGQRTHELGIRMALGQTKTSILGMVVRQGALLAFGGTILGLSAAVALARFLSSLLYQTSPTDLATYSAVSLVFLTTALVACFVPARRVTSIDPSRALRQE
jgi:putative ABC transport system permease protein